MTGWKYEDEKRCNKSKTGDIHSYNYENRR